MVSVCILGHLSQPGSVIWYLLSWMDVTMGLGFWFGLGGFRLNWTSLGLATFLALPVTATTLLFFFFFSVITLSSSHQGPLASSDVSET